MIYVLSYDVKTNKIITNDEYTDDKKRHFSHVFDETYFSGPNVIAYISEKPIDVAKVLSEAIDLYKEKMTIENEEFEHQKEIHQEKVNKFYNTITHLAASKNGFAMCPDSNLLEANKLTEADYYMLVEYLNNYYKREELKSEGETTKQYIDSVLEKGERISLAYTTTTTTQELPIQVEYDVKTRHMITSVNGEVVEDIEFSIEDLNAIEFSGLTGEWEEYDSHEDVEKE